MNMKEIALSYLDKGVAVMPIWSPEMVKRRPNQYFEELKGKLERNMELENPEQEDVIKRKLLIDFCKRPILPKWKTYSEKSPTREDVTSWFTENPDANIAIITGEVSGIFVVDLDSSDAEKYAAEKGGFGNTPGVVTGRGSQYYLKRPDFPIGNSSNRERKIDVRGDGGYVVAPPSIHGSGRQYKWMEDCSIHDVDPVECPEWVLDFIKNPPKKQLKATPPVAAVQANTNASAQKIEGNKFVDILKNGTSAGDRNHTAASLVGHLMQTVKDTNEVWEIINLWNMKNSPPLDQNELRKTFDSVRSMDAKGKLDIDSLLDNANKAAADYKERYVRIPFGGQNLQNLENKMSGGLAGGRLYIIGGIPSAGKTVLTNNIADNICRNGYPVLFFSYDDGRVELRYRTLSRFTGQAIELFNVRSLPDIKSFYSNPDIAKIVNLKYVVENQITVEKWEESMEAIHKKHGVAPVIIIDYLRKLKTESKSNDERLRIDDMLSKLTTLAKKHNTPIVAISELARDSYKSGQRLSIASFKETGMIEYEASWLGILAPIEEKDGEYQIADNWEKIIQQDGNIDIIVFKAKRGTGFTGKIPLKLDKDKMTVVDRPEDPKKKKKATQFD